MGRARDNQIVSGPEFNKASMSTGGFVRDWHDIIDLALFNRLPLFFTRRELATSLNYPFRCRAPHDEPVSLACIQGHVPCEAQRTHSRVHDIMKPGRAGLGQQSFSSCRQMRTCSLLVVQHEGIWKSAQLLHSRIAAILLDVIRSNRGTK